MGKRKNSGVSRDEEEEVEVENLSSSNEKSLYEVFLEIFIDFFIIWIWNLGISILLWVRCSFHCIAPLAFPWKI